MKGLVLLSLLEAKVCKTILANRKGEIPWNM